MAFFQWQQIDPGPDELARALAEAAGLGAPTESERRAALTQAAGSAAGSLAWGDEPSSHGPFRRVACTWWTDHLGRRHWLIERDDYRLVGGPDPRWRCLEGAPFHPLWALAPLCTAVRGAGAGASLVVVCDCGVVGTPEAVAWTGRCCGPCFDRQLDGVRPPPPLALLAHQSSAISVAFTEDDRLASGGWDGSLCLYDPQTGEEDRLDATDLGGAEVAMLPDNRVVVAFIRATVVCWDLTSGEEQWRMHCPGELMGVVSSPRGDLVAVDAVTTSYLLDADTGEGERLSEDLSHFAFSPDGATLYAYNSDNRTVVALDTATDQLRATGLEFGEPEEDDCYSLICSPTGQLLASGGNHGRVRLGDPKAGRWLHRLDGPPGLVASLAFTPDGRTLASGHDDRIVFWDAEAGTPRELLQVPGHRVGALAFSRDGQTLAIGDEQGGLRLWPWRRIVECNEQGTCQITLLSTRCTSSSPAGRRGRA
jgi:sugar lactone lactonase YvrE